MMLKHISEQTPIRRQYCDSGIISRRLAMVIRQLTPRVIQAGKRSRALPTRTHKGTTSKLLIDMIALIASSALLC